jgi:hypothetical protein
LAILGIKGSRSTQIAAAAQAAQHESSALTPPAALAAGWSRVLADRAALSSALAEHAEPGSSAGQTLAARKASLEKSLRSAALTAHLQSCASMG